MFDRGGLIYVKHSVVDLLEGTEVNFRSKFSSGYTNSHFVKDCLEDRVLLTKFYDVCYDVQAGEESQESVLTGFLKLFFKIRAHNKCKFFMDEYRNN